MIYPIDEEAQCDKKIKWNNCNNIFHLRYKGQVQYNENDEDTLSEEFKSIKCEGGGIKEQMIKIKHFQEKVD